LSGGFLSKPYKKKSRSDLKTLQKKPYKKNDSSTLSLSFWVTLRLKIGSNKVQSCQKETGIEREKDRERERKTGVRGGSEGGERESDTKREGVCVCKRERVCVCVYVCV